MFVIVRSVLGDRGFKALVLVVVLVLVIGMFVFNNIEHWGLLNSLYFCVITLTTVGYGDYTPHTETGKIVTMVYIFLGIGVMLALVGIIAKNITGYYVKLAEDYIKKTEEYFEDILDKTVRKIEK